MSDLSKLADRRIAAASGKGKIRYPKWQIGSGDSAEGFSCQLTAEIVGFVCAGKTTDRNTILVTVGKVLDVLGVPSDQRPKPDSLKMRIGNGLRQARDPFQKIDGCKCRMVKGDGGMVSFASGRVARAYDAIVNAIAGQKSALANDKG